MCGVAGVFSIDEDVNCTSVLNSMSEALLHRGPDASGIWKDANAYIGLTHRRLSILDLSEAGAQPMHSASQRFVLVFNGEIYNHLSLRKAIEAESSPVIWEGYSDTETLLAAIETWGLNGALSRARGMFAIALWDRFEQSLSLARDRLGEKPIYLASISSGWVFSSEIGALFEVPSFDAHLDRGAVAAFLAYGYVPDRMCILKNVTKVEPGSILTLTAPGSAPRKERYFEFETEIQRSAADRCNTIGRDYQKELKHLDSVLHEVVEEQMLSDVPIGCFLSGGIDSSLIAAVMQSQRDTQTKTFSIGFREARFNEAPRAAAVARHLKTDHTEFILSEDDALGVVVDLPHIYDEPFADSSQIPTAILCREARKRVTVALTGDGGDEVFGGYNRHVLGPKLAHRIKQVPEVLRRMASGVLQAAGPLLLPDRGAARRIATGLKLPVTAIDKAISLAPMISDARNLEEVYRFLTRGIHRPSDYHYSSTSVSDPVLESELTGSEWLMAMDTISYLPGDILVKVDRAAMASSLETRAPFLDARVLSAAWKLPLDMKIENGRGKRVLRSLLCNHVPDDLTERPKQGFSIPIDSWLRGALFEWAEELLQRKDLFHLAGLNASAIQSLWTKHQTRQGNHGTPLWTILALLSWLRAHRKNIVDPATEPSC